MSSLEQAGYVDSASTYTEGLVIDSATEQPHLGAVFYFEDMPEAINPLRKKVPGLGPITLVANNNSETGRPDRWYKIEIDGFGYGVRETSPLPEENSGVTLVDFGGFSELIELGSAKNRHDSLATHLPSLRIVSVANDGMGTTGDRLTIENAFDHGVNEMALGRLKLLEALCSDGPVITEGVSMGSIIVWKMLDHDARHGHNLNAYPVGYASALVPPGKTWLYMGTLFPPSMLLDIPRELVWMAFRRGPSSIRSLLPQAEKLCGNSLPMAAHLISMAGGTALSEILRVSKDYGGGTSISGQLDPLAQFGLLSLVKQRYGDFHIKRVAGRGHGMAADGQGAGRAIAGSLSQWQILDKIAA